MGIIILILVLAFVVGVPWIMFRQIRKILRKHKLELENAEYQNKKNQDEAAARAETRRPPFSGTPL